MANKPKLPIDGGAFATRAFFAIALAILATLKALPVLGLSSNPADLGDWAGMVGFGASSVLLVWSLFTRYRL